MDTAAAVGAGVEQQAKELPQLLLLGPPPLQFHAALANSFRLLKPWEDKSMSTQQFFTTHAQSVRALISIGLQPVNSETLRCLPSLQCVVGTSVGVDHIDLAECRRRGIVVTNAGPSFSEDAADFTVGLLLDVLRRISAADRYVRQGLWPVKGDYPLGSKLGGKRVGIIGMGSIGSEVAKRLESFGCNISYNSRKKKPSVAFPFYSNVHELAANSDVLILSCALTKETYHIIDRDVLLALGEKGVIINVGRGALIDEKELVRCLVQGEIGAAGLDVYENEPYVPIELLVLDNVVLSPHKAVLTPESLSASAKMAMDNLEAFYAGKPLLSPVLDE